MVLFKQLARLIQYGSPLWILAAVMFSQGLIAQGVAAQDNAVGNQEGGNQQTWTVNFKETDIEE